MRKSIGYRLFIWGLLLASLLLLWRLNGILTHPKYVPVDDFVRHWASGYIFITHGNPYSPEQIQVLQDQVTAPFVKAEVITPNYIPPWTMLLLGVFGLFDYPISRLMWLIFNIILLLVSIELSWKLYSGPIKYKWLALLIGFSFGSSIAVLEKGQTTCLVLLGIVGFVYFVEYKPNFWIAGMFSSLITIKPQLFYLFWVALLFWSFKQRSLLIVSGCGFTLLALSSITLYFDSKIFTEYLRAFLDYPPTLFATPTIGGYLRYYLIGINQFWPQFIPVIVGLIWGVYHWNKHYRIWQWSKEIPVLIFASIILSSYCWTYDMVLLVVPVLQAWIWLISARKDRILGIFSLVHFLISFLDLILHRYLDDFWFIWFAPATLIWYLLNSNYYKKDIQKYGINDETLKPNSNYSPPPDMPVFSKPEN